MGESNLKIEKKKVLSVKAREHEFQFLIRHSYDGDKEKRTNEDNKGIELSEKTLGKFFEEGTHVKISIFYEPLTTIGKSWNPESRTLLSYQGRVKYNQKEFNPITLINPLDETENIYGKYGTNSPIGYLELVIEEILEKGSLSISLNNQK